MSTAIDPTTLAITSVSSNPSSDFYSGINTTSTYYKIGEAISTIPDPYYGSKTTIQLTDDGSTLTVTTDGDPYPALSGDGSNNDATMTNTNERDWYDDPNPFGRNAKYL